MLRNQHKQFAPFGRRADLPAGRCWGRYQVRLVCVHEIVNRISSHFAAQLAPVRVTP
jgi:hypothetical protein